MCTCGSQWKDHVYALLRVLTGFVFVYHGYDKVFGMGIDATAKFFTSVGIPAANILAPLVAYGELLGGIALMVGFLTHWVSKAFVVIMLGAIWFVHLSKGFSVMDGGYEYPLVLLVLSVFFLVHGAGKFSIDAKRGTHENHS